MTELDDVQAIVSQHGYTADRASLEYAKLFEGDLDEADKYDLGRTWRQDWKAELYATLANSDGTFCVTSDDHTGVAIFGATSIDDRIAQMWLLQSKSFSSDAFRFHGLAWPHKASLMTREMIGLFQASHASLFNFISEKQVRNIKWLKSSGFLFFEHPEIKSDMLFFGRGDNVSTLASDVQFWNHFLGEEFFNG